MEESRKAVLAVPTLDEDSRQLEKEYPGIFAATWAAIEPQLRKSLGAENERYWAALEDLYISRLNEPEAQALLKFYRSPTGQKLIRNLHMNVDVMPIIPQVLNSNSGAVSADQMRAVTDAAKVKALQSLEADDMDSFQELSTGLSLQKLGEIGQATEKLTLEWVNKSDPEFDSRLEALMTKAMEDYMVKHPPRK